MQSFGMAIAFLEDALIVEKTLKPGVYESYNPNEKCEELDFMILDS
jgi:hypothetical protein